MPAPPAATPAPPAPGLTPTTLSLRTLPTPRAALSAATASGATVTPRPRTTCASASPQVRQAVSTGGWLLCNALGSAVPGADSTITSCLAHCAGCALHTTQATRPRTCWMPPTTWVPTLLTCAPRAPSPTGRPTTAASPPTARPASPAPMRPPRTPTHPVLVRPLDSSCPPRSSQVPLPCT